MTGSLSITLPVLGNPNSSEDANVRSALVSLRDDLNALLTTDNHLDGSQVKAQSATAGQIPIFNSSSLQVATSLSGDVTVDSSGVTTIGSGKVTSGKILDGTILATDLNGAITNSYKTIFQASGITTGATSTITYIMDNSPTNTGDSSVSGNNVAGVTTAGNCPLFYFNSADWSFGSLTEKLRIRAQVATNATGPGITYTVGLYPVTTAGGAGALTFTLGTVVSGSNGASFASPSASTVSQDNSGDFTIPSNGAYALGFTTSGSAAANNVTLLYAQLQVRNT